MVNKRFSGELKQRFNERSELERFRDRFSEAELQGFVDKYAGLWRPAFERNHGRFDAGVDGYPLHPWKVLKRERERFAEEENDGDWPEMPKRHALRVVKEEFVEKWRAEAYSD